MRRCRGSLTHSSLAHLALAVVVGLPSAVTACTSGEEDPSSSGHGGTAGAAGSKSTGGAAGRGGAAGKGGAPDAGRSGGNNASGASGRASAQGGTSGVGGTLSEGGAAGEDYVPVMGDCGFDAPAFCDTFEQGPVIGGVRTGELDPERWSVVRAVPSLHASLDEAYEIGPAFVPECRAGLSNTMVVPDHDTVICEPTASIASRHFLGAVAAQNYGLNTYRIRQPFDFAGRTGTIKLDVELTAGGLGGWPAIAITEDPSPAPSYDFPEHASGPRNGVQIDFNFGYCNTPHTILPGFYSTRDFVETAHDVDTGCDQPYAKTSPGLLNHVELRVSASGVEVWASDASPDGLSFPNFQRIGALALELPFDRGYVTLVTRNHATLKYWAGPSWSTRWDNVGFDGPRLGDTREYSAPEPLDVRQGISGCLIDGACVSRGQTILDHPDGGDLCAESCEAEGEGRTVGYVVPNEDETPVAIPIPDVRTSGVTRARLVWAADYPWFEWNGVFPAPTALNLRYRLNGGAFHDRFVSEVEVNAFGGEQGGAGLLNQVTEVDASELIEGLNTLELSGSGTWTGAYRMGVVGVDLVLDVAP